MDKLSPRENEVIELLAEGLTTYAIGIRLGIAYKTARNHITNIYRKLNVSSRPEASALYTEWRLSDEHKKADPDYFGRLFNLDRLY